MNISLKLIELTGTVSTYSGSTNFHMDGIGSLVLFGGIQGVALDSSGTMYVSDNVNSIRKAQSNGEERMGRGFGG